MASEADNVISTRTSRGPFTENILPSPQPANPQSGDFWNDDVAADNPGGSGHLFFFIGGAWKQVV